MENKLLKGDSANMLKSIPSKSEDYFTMASERIGCVAEGLGISLDTKTSNDVKPFPTVKKAANRRYSTAKSDRAENDYYATDPLAAQLLLQNEGFSHNVWECASGENHLADVFRHYGYYVRTSDIVKRTQTTEVLDFLDCNVECWNGDIITNPPYSHSQEFVEKALSVISNGHKVAMFLRLQFLEGICRYKLFKENPPKVVYVSAKRIRCGKDGDFNTSSSGINAYAWYVWEKGYKGETSVKWINHGESVNEEKIRANRKSMEVKPLVLCDSDLLSERFKMKVVDKKGKKRNLYIQRVECGVYEKLGFSRYDYVGGKPINKAAMCFLVTTSKGQPLGFLGFLNHTFKGCSNGMKVSRFVLSPQFRGKALALPILSRTCGILKSRGYRVFINTESHKLGGRLMASCNYRSTTFNCVNRAIKKDDRYKGRRSGTAYRLEYCGNSVYGYGIMLGKLADMRARKLNLKYQEKRKQPFTPTPHNHLTFYGCIIVPLYVDSRNGMCYESHIAWFQTPQYMSRGSPFGMSGWGLNLVKSLPSTEPRQTKSNMCKMTYQHAFACKLIKPRCLFWFTL